MTQEEFRQQIPHSIILPQKDLSSLTIEELAHFLIDFEHLRTLGGGPVVCSVTGIRYSEEEWKEMESQVGVELHNRAGTQPSEDTRPRTVEEWQDTPSPNPRYRGATPADVGRALLRKPACHAKDKIDSNSSPVKKGV